MEKIPISTFDFIYIKLIYRTTTTKNDMGEIFI